MPQPRPASTVLTALIVLTACAAPAQAQGALGLGGRLSMVRPDVTSSASALRFVGGQLRARLSPRTSVELSLDRRRETSLDLIHRTTDYPLQASLLVYPIRSTLSPYVLGGFGWYTHQDQILVGSDVASSVSTHQTGYHAGFGGELRLGRHAAAHADYRYTFLHLGGTDGGTDTSSLASRFLPSYDGSMWTAGFTLYF